MLIVLPSALFPLLLVLDVLQAWQADTVFWGVGFWIAALGVVGTLAAMVPGIIDMASIPDGTKAHRTGMWHALVGTLTLLAYVAATWVRYTGAPAAAYGVGLGIDVAGVLLVTIQGWLGGELVYKHHVGVLSDREGGEPTVLLTKGQTGPMPEAGRRAGEDARRRDAGRP